MVSVSGAKQVINLFVHSYGQSLVRKPKVVQMFAEDLSKLKYAPQLEGDVVQLSLKPKTILGYQQRQTMDIAKYGEKQVERIDVTEEMLQKFTPHRRLSNKPCTLKNPKDYEYYISKYEKEMGEEYLPKDWTSLTEAQKYDFIVKDRYSRLVSNKIMNSIQHEQVEHCYVLNKDGDITNYTLGDSSSVKSTKIELNGTSIHNHPMNLNTKTLGINIPQKYFMSKDEFIKNISNAELSHSTSDIYLGIIEGGKHYVVDAIGNKFCFISNNIPQNDEVLQFITRVLDKIDIVTNSFVDKYLINQIADFPRWITLAKEGSEWYQKMIKDFHNDIYRASKQLASNQLTSYKSNMIQMMSKTISNTYPEIKCGMKLEKL